MLNPDKFVWWPALVHTGIMDLMYIVIMVLKDWVGWESPPALPAKIYKYQEVSLFCKLPRSENRCVECWGSPHHSNHEPRTSSSKCMQEVFLLPDFLQLAQLRGLSKKKKGFAFLSLGKKCGPSIFSELWDSRFCSCPTCWICFSGLAQDTSAAWDKQQNFNSSLQL